MELRIFTAEISGQTWRLTIAPQPDGWSRVELDEKNGEDWFIRGTFNVVGRQGAELNDQDIANAIAALDPQNRILFLLNSGNRT